MTLCVTNVPRNASMDNAVNMLEYTMIDTRNRVVYADNTMIDAGYTVVNMLGYTMIYALRSVH